MWNCYRYRSLHVVSWRICIFELICADAMEGLSLEAISNNSPIFWLWPFRFLLVASHRSKGTHLDLLRILNLVELQSSVLLV